MPRRPTSQLTAALAPLIPAALLLGHGLLVWGYTNVEASTVLCYAVNLANGQGPALQPGAVWSYGFASIPWVLLLAAVEALGLELMLVAKAAGLGLAALAVYLLARVPGCLLGRGELRPLDLLAPLLLALNPSMARQAVGGLETGLTLVLLVWLLRWFVTEERRACAGVARHRAGDLRSALPLCLLLLNCPEAPVVWGTLVLYRLLARVTAWRLQLSTAAWLLLPALVYGLLLLGSYLLFAEPLSGVVSAREALSETRLGDPLALRLGWASVARLWQQWGVTAALVGVALVGAVRPINYWARAALAGLAVITVLAVVVTGGDASGRLTLPALLCGAVLAADGLQSLIRRLWPGQGNGRLRQLGVLALVLGLAAPPALAALRASDAAPRSSDRGALDQAFKLEQLMGELGWEASQVSLLTSRPGAAARFGFEVVDASGVTDPAILHNNSKRYPLQLQQLILAERRPDVIMEQGPWKVVHGFTSHPEARRRYVRVKLPGHPGVKVAVSRGLLLEPAPLLDPGQRRDLGRGLWLLGWRVEPGRMVLLWTTQRKVRRARRLRLRLGQAFVAELQIGPAIYPLRRWRPGEVVRQVLPLPNSVPHHSLPLELDAGRGWQTVGRVDGSLLLMDGQKWLRRQQRAYVLSGTQDLLELLPYLTRRPGLQLAQVNHRLLQRTRRLLRQGLLGRAARQLHLARFAMPRADEVHQLGAQLARAAYARAQRRMRRSSWSVAFADLRAAASAQPHSPWIARRLEQARQRLPAGSHLVQALELELAQRALALAPSPSGLTRVLKAHLARQQYHEAMAAYLAWHSIAGKASEQVYLVAQAMGQLGWLKRARDLTDMVLPGRILSSLPRRCPPEHQLNTIILNNELQGMLGQLPRQRTVDTYFAGDRPQLRQHTVLLAHCTRWRPGEPLTVDLLLLQRRPEPLSMLLTVGSRRQRLTLPAGAQPLRRIRKRFVLPPATYPIRLDPGHGRPVIDLGRRVVGPQSTFGFELPTWGASSWRRAGEAFGPGPAVGRSLRGRLLFGYVGERFADSFAAGIDKQVGSITSPAFKIDRDYLMLLVAGGDSPALGVDLWHQGRRLATVRGHRSEVLRAVFLPVARYRGRWVKLRVRDNARGKWGHIAVDEIRLLDGPAKGVAP